MGVKRHWIGDRWYLPGAEGNDIKKVSRLDRFSSFTEILTQTQTNVPNIRLAYRQQTLVGELELVSRKSIVGAFPDFGMARVRAVTGGDASRSLS
jgi:AMP deaminase